MAINPNTDFTAGQVLTSSQANRFPRGVVGAQQLTTVFSTSATHTTYQDTGLTLTLALSSSRLYRFNVQGNPYPSGGLQAIAYRLVEAGTERMVWNLAEASLQTTSSLAISMNMYYQPASSSSTIYKIQMKAVTANTAVSDFGSATSLRQFWIEDMGPA